MTATGNSLRRSAPGRAFATLPRELRARPLLASLCLLALIADAAAGLLPPIGIGFIVDVVSHARPLTLLAPAFTLLIAGALIAAVTTAATAGLLARVTEPALATVRERALGGVLRTDAARIERAGSGDVAARLTGDIERLSDAATGALGAFVAAGLSIVATLIGLAALDWRFAVAGLLAVPIQLHTLRWYLRSSGPIYRAERTAESVRTQRLLDSVRGATAARALREEVALLDRVRAASGEAIVLEQRAVRLGTRFYGRLNIAEFIGLAAIILVGFFTVQSGAATVGVATTAALFFIQLFGPINTVLGLFDIMQQAAASVTRVVGLAELEPVRTSHVAGPRTPGPVEVCARGISAHYGDRSALTGIDLTLNAGERVAVVGASGAGKSTLARVIAGFVQPTGGAIVIAGAGGVPASSADVALIEQTPHTFLGTLAEDLRLARPHATDKELESAAKLAGIVLGHGTFAADLHTRLGANGVMVSAAEAQHIALARLVLANPGLAILDEASADAGSATARKLEQAIDRVLQGRTALVIAHRLSQAVSADRVLVMEAGRIVAAGPHYELLQSDARYRALWDVWSEARTS